MAAYTNLALNNATKERDERDAAAKVAALSTEAKQAQSQYGDLFQEPVGLSGAQSRNAGQTWTAGETARRDKAAQGAYELGGSIDKSASEASNATQAALNTIGNANTKSANALNQAEKNTQQGIAEAGEANRQQYATMNFSEYKSITQRSDAIANAYIDGTINMALLGAQQQGKLKVFDVTKYWALRQADIQNDMKDLSAVADAEFQIKLAELKAKTDNDNALLGALFKGVAIWAAS